MNCQSPYLIFVINFNQNVAFEEVGLGVGSYAYQIS